MNLSKEALRAGVSDIEAEYVLKCLKMYPRMLKALKRTVDMNDADVSDQMKEINSIIQECDL